LALLLALSYFSFSQEAESAAPAPEDKQASASPALAPGDIVLRDLGARGISFQGQMVYDWSKSFADADSGNGFGRYSSI
jgi:hypothetical protein